jgi:NAD(P)-dependent dehydrogenase (short-subunit alcohol dehydrogenase family)
MEIKGTTVLVTGANRGLGQALVQALQEAGCAKIYAGARRVDGRAASGAVHPVQLDITNAKQVLEAAEQCHDIGLLINNAGMAAFAPALGSPTIDDARREMETNYFGTLAMCRAFAPVLKRAGGGALVNVLSVVSWFNAPMQGTYCASKSAEWSLTKAVRFELRSQGTLVAGVYAGYIETDMTTGITGLKSSPKTIAARVISGIENNEEEILADSRAESVSSELLKDYGPFEANIQKLWDDYKLRRNGERD